MKKIKVSKESEARKLNGSWNYCVGTGRMGLALQKEYLDHLEMVQKDIGFKYIRGHGLLSDDVGIYREDEVDGKMQPFYNFTYIDRIYDSFLERGIKPFIELGFMPSALASGDQTVFYWKGNVTPPKDYTKWADLIKNVLTHFIERYGLEEVLTWPVEVWNEPNLQQFWKDADKDEYFKLYKVSSIAVKEVHPNLQVGGPVTCGGADQWIIDFIAFCQKENVPVDFISRHTYSSINPTITPHFYHVDLVENTHLLKEFATLREFSKGTPYENLPAHVTEFNSSYDPISPVHDTVFNAAYMARVLSEGGDTTDSFSYWTFSDVFEEKDVPRSQFHGGFGLVALNGICKPTYYTFKFFKQLGDDIIYRDEKAIVTRKKNGSIAMILWNEISEKGGGFEKEIEIELPLDFDRAFVKKQTISEDYGNPWKTWIQMGRPRFPDKKTVETLKEIAKPFVSTSSEQVTDGKITLKFTLTKNEVSLIEISKIKDESGTYIGLDDSKIMSY